jgi:predicted phosphodiesterase
MLGHSDFKMRIAALYDIHGNLPALEAVLGEIRETGADQIVVGGDVLPGPMPAATLDCLMALEIPARFLYGNGEIAVLEQLDGRDPAQVPEAYRPVIRWNAEQLSPAQQNELRSWPKVIRLNDVLFCHATPRDENECFTDLTAENLLLPVFAGVDAPLVVCGHTHMQFDRRIGKTRVVNAGSVGMPFGSAGADWLWIDGDVQLRHTDYDLSRAAERVRATNYPGADEFAARHILNPPAAAEMLQAFTNVHFK